MITNHIGWLQTKSPPKKIKHYNSLGSLCLFWGTNLTSLVSTLVPICGKNVKRKRIMILPLRVLMSLQHFLWIIWDYPFFQANKKCIEKKDAQISIIVEPQKWLAKYKMNAL
jgi:hypothetical protein